jgi:hypothetical protein
MNSLTIKYFLSKALAFLIILSDFYTLKNKIAAVYSSAKTFLAQKKTGKRGVEPLTFGFGNHCSTN